jgi:tRNA (guanine-N7-)-methyltransferase
MISVNKSYVIRSGRMSDAQKRSYETLSPRYRLCPEKEAFDIETAFGRGGPLVVEIGFGMGAATAVIAGQNPGINYLGLEVYKPGIGKLFWEIEKRELKNVRVIEGDAVETVEKQIRENSVSGFHIFFPDPWPKKRHHKRRLVTRPFTDLLASRLVPGGYVYMVTDWEDYACQALAELEASGGLVNAYSGFAPPQPWRPLTKFESRGKMNHHEIRELYFVKK